MKHLVMVLKVEVEKLEAKSQVIRRLEGYGVHRRTVCEEILSNRIQ